MHEGILTLFAEGQKFVPFAGYSNQEVAGWPPGFRIRQIEKDRAEARQRRKDNLDKCREADRKRYRESPVRRLLMMTYANSERRKQKDRERYLRKKAERENQGIPG